MSNTQLSIEIQPLNTANFLQALDKFDTLDKTLRHNITVFIPHIVTKPYHNVITAVKQLKKEHLKTCPHFAVRNLSPTDDIGAIFAEYQQLQIDKLLVLGGDSPHPHHFRSVRDFLNESHPFPCKTVGFGFFPSKHPHCDANTQLSELKFKIEWAKKNQLKTELYSQICFNADEYKNYLTTLTHNNIDSPIHIGFVSPCKITKLASIAKYVGVANSFNFMQKTNVFKLLSHYHSRDFITPLMGTQNLGGYHCYAFGNFNDGLTQLLSIKKILNNLSLPHTS